MKRRTWKRKITILLAICIVMSGLLMYSFPAQAEDTLVYSENFDTATVVTDTKWKITDESSNCTVSVVANPDGEGKVLAVSRTTGNTGKLVATTDEGKNTSHFEKTDKTVLEYRIKATGDCTFFLPTLAYGGAQTNDLVRLVLSEGQLCYQGSDGKNQTICAFSNGEWHTVKLIVDSDSETPMWYLWLDGELVTHQTSLQNDNKNGKQARSIYFGSTSGSQDIPTIYLDDFVAKKFDEVIDLIEVDGEIITSLKDALSAANTATDKTVTLLDDVKVTDEELSVSYGITLDLAGYDIDLGDTNYLNVYNGANVIDSKGGGLLKVAEGKLILPENNSYMPVWDSTNSGYRLADVKIDDSSLGSVTTTETSMSYITRPVFHDYLSDVEKLVAAGTDTSDTEIRIRLTWKLNGEPHSQDCYFPANVLEALYGGTEKNATKFTVTGLNIEGITDFTATTIVKSGSGVVKAGTAHAYVAPTTEAAE